MTRELPTLGGIQISIQPQGCATGTSFMLDEQSEGCGTARCQDQSYKMNDSIN